MKLSIVLIYVLRDHVLGMQSLQKINGLLFSPSPSGDGKCLYFYSVLVSLPVASSDS